jgi:hypothetical protein
MKSILSGPCYAKTYTTIWTLSARKPIPSQVPVTHTYNHSYSGGRDQEDRGSKQAWADSSKRPYLEKPTVKKEKKRAGGVTQGVGPEFKLQYHKNKKKKANTRCDSLSKNHKPN